MLTLVDALQIMVGLGLIGGLLALIGYSIYELLKG